MKYNNSFRRYDIDWLRVLALGLLIIYHVSIIFQPWAHSIYFIQSEISLEIIWLIMGLINIWRMPLLFIISGMSISFAIKKKSWRELLGDRTKRILIPLIFGSLFIVPIHMYFYQQFTGIDYVYLPNPGHLWFLSNIFIYFLILAPIVFYLNRNIDNIFLRLSKRALTYPIALYLITIPFIIEAKVLLKPGYSFESYATTAHGFVIGLLAFLSGFFFILIGNPFWSAVKKIKNLTLLISIVLYIIRLIIFKLEGPSYLIVIESWSWLFTILGFGSTYLNHPSIRLTYLNTAVYPVYILHMIFIFMASNLILTKPIYVNHVYTIENIQLGSQAEIKGLLKGDHLITNLKNWKSNIPLDIKVKRNNKSFKISITPDEEKEIGVILNKPIYHIPVFKDSKTTIKTVLFQFMFINLITFIGCFVSYEIIKKIKYLRLFLGIK